MKRDNMKRRNARIRRAKRAAKAKATQSRKYHRCKLSHDTKRSMDSGTPPNLSPAEPSFSTKSILAMFGLGRR